MQEDQSLGTDRFYIVSSIPGRIRWKIPELYQNEALAHRLQAWGSGWPGVRKVQINLYSRSLLILYEPQRSSPRNLSEELHNLIVNYQRIEEETAEVRQATASTVEEELPSSNATHEPIIFTQRPDPWYRLSLPELHSMLQTDLNHGLDTSQAESLLAQVGLNQFPKQKPPSILEMFLEQLNEFLPKLLLGASGLSMLLGQWGDVVTIAAIVLVESALGVWQNMKAEKSLDTLQEYTQTNCTAIRNGTIQHLPAKFLVPGDLVTLKAGDLIPADARLLNSSNLKVNESALTGESEPVDKTHKIKYTSTIPLADRKNMLYMGTTILRGTAKAVVVETGLHTEMGQIANLIQETEPEPTPLQKDLERLAKTLTLGCLGVSGAIMGINLLRGRPLLEILRSGVSLAIGTVPEGLTAVLAVALSFGVQRMSKKGAIVKKLPVVESLSCADIICTDKTGTLTKGEMTVQKVYTASGEFEVTGVGYSVAGEIQQAGSAIAVDQHPELQRLVQVGVLCNDASYRQTEVASSPQGHQPLRMTAMTSDEYFSSDRAFSEAEGRLKIVGDPSEGALWVLAAKAGLTLDMLASYSREKELPFDSEAKRMVTLCRDEDYHFSVNVKGAPDVLLERCTQIQDGHTVRKLTPEDRRKIRWQMELMAEEALRVMGFAYRELAHQPESQAELEEDWIFVGLTGMMDPPRPEVQESIEKCQDAGIRVVMITGDHPKTATAIGDQIGLLRVDDRVITGAELEELSDEDLAQQVDQIAIYARTSPHQKLRIVRALQGKGHIVAMTGDGVNDAPAIKAANVGIAMGKNGTDVTREAASIILTDDNFTTIVKAIEEGRTISGNIKKFMRFILAGNVGQVLAVGAAALLGLPAPLLPGAILMVDLLTEGVTSLALGVDPPDVGVMNQPPRNAQQSIFDKDVQKKIISRGILMGITTFGMYLGGLSLTGNVAMARTMAYANLVVSQLVHVFDLRNAPLAENKLVIPAVSAASVLLLVSIFTPGIAGTLGVCRIGMIGLGAVALGAGMGLVLPQISSGQASNTHSSMFPC